jgi:DUF1016 N-terminal domain
MPITASHSDSKSVTPLKNNTHTNPSDTAPSLSGAELSLALTQRKKEAGLAGMSNILFERYERIQPLLDKQRRSDAACKYEIGGHVVEVLANENAYGSGAAEKLAKALEVTRPTFDAYARVARTWTPKQFEALMKRRSQRRKRPLSFSHLIEISRFSDKADRKMWIDLVLKNEWSVRDLRKEMVKKLNETPTNDSGATENNEDHVDSTPAEQTDEVGSDSSGDGGIGSGETSFSNSAAVRLSIARLSSEVLSIPRQEEEWDARVFKPLEDAHGQIDDAMVEALEQTSESIEESIGSLQGRKKRIGDLLKPTRRAKRRPAATSVEEGGDVNGN